jgi:phospholipase A2
VKANAPRGTINLLDIYGTLISSRLFIPSNIEALDPDNLSLHKFRRFTDDGSMPLPIFTAIQHGISSSSSSSWTNSPSLEIPHDTEKSLEQVREQRDYLVDQSRYEMLQQEDQELENKTRWLWYEFTPYEVGCDELGVSYWPPHNKRRNLISLGMDSELEFR